MRAPLTALLTSLSLLLGACGPIVVHVKRDDLAAREAQPKAEQRFGNILVRDGGGNYENMRTTEDATGAHIPWHEPGRLLDLTFVADEDSDGDVTTEWVDVAGGRTFCFQLVMANTSTPIGTLAVQGSLDETNVAAIFLDENRVYGQNFAAFSGGTSVSISSPAGTVIILACLEPSLPRVRLFYDSTSGGAADTIDIATFIRAE